VPSVDRKERAWLPILQTVRGDPNRVVARYDCSSDSRADGGACNDDGDDGDVCGGRTVPVPAPGHGRAFLRNRLEQMHWRLPK